MKVGEEFEYKGVRYKVESEKREFSCHGCYLVMNCSKNRTGCSAKSEDVIFSQCKHDHVIFVKI